MPGACLLLYMKHYESLPSFLIMQKQNHVLIVVVSLRRPIMEPNACGIMVCEVGVDNVSAPSLEPRYM